MEKLPSPDHQWVATSKKWPGKDGDAYPRRYEIWINDHLAQAFDVKPGMRQHVHLEEWSAGRLVVSYNEEPHDHVTDNYGIRSCLWFLKPIDVRSIDGKIRRGIGENDWEWDWTARPGIISVGGQDPQRYDVLHDKKLP